MITLMAALEEKVKMFMNLFRLVCERKKDKSECKKEEGYVL